jgi:hypothetical protein
MRIPGRVRASFAEKPEFFFRRARPIANANRPSERWPREEADRKGELLPAASNAQRCRASCHHTLPHAGSIRTVPTPQGGIVAAQEAASRSALESNPVGQHGCAARAIDARDTGLRADRERLVTRIPTTPSHVRVPVNALSILKKT